MADPQVPLKTIGMALHGQALKIDEFGVQPKLPKVEDIMTPSKWQDWEPAVDIDYSDLGNINKELISLRIRLNQIRKELRVAERFVASLRWVYEGKKKRILIGLSGGSADAREAAAELLCEEEYSSLLVASTVLKELAQHNRDLRAELDLLKELSNNLRRMVDLM